MRYGVTFRLCNILDDCFGLDWLGVLDLDFQRGEVFVPLREVTPCLLCDYGVEL
jgi:hypothetical protein